MRVKTLFTAEAHPIPPRLQQTMGAKTPEINGPVDAVAPRLPGVASRDQNFGRVWLNGTKVCEISSAIGSLPKVEVRPASGSA